MIKVMQKLFGGVVNEQNYAEFLKELGKRFVPKAEYNAKLAELKELRAKANERAVSAEELDGAKAAAANLAAEVELLRAKLDSGRRERLAEVALMRAGAKNLRAAGALLDLGDLPQGREEETLAERVARLKLAEGTAFLFERESVPVAAEWQGFVPAEAGDAQESGYAGGFKLRLAQAQNAADCLGAIRVKQEAAANGFII